jgi:hypothetical protein
MNPSLCVLLYSDPNLAGVPLRVDNTPNLQLQSIFFKFMLRKKMHYACKK